ncbi:TonB-dependent receptor [Prolixibacteraceae bacterium JC049]|nr:TonB-dependent receptor [Prolixibacteraceae bacterium JC049]
MSCFMLQISNAKQFVECKFDYEFTRLASANKIKIGKTNILMKKIFDLRTLMTILMVSWLSLNVFSQNRIDVSGHIMGNNNEPIIGATIVVKGTTIGTVTDIDGNFAIPQVPDNALLLVKFIGYKEKELKPAAKLQITLEEDVLEVGEVQIVAYGTQKKATITGAISSIKSDELLKTPSANVMNTLAGALPGVMTVQNSGQPGSEDPRIFIRGAGTLDDSGSSPLILVDGVERSFSQLDPNEIENVTVLKDASATAVFGVRGANGVILVTTKRGKAGKASVSVSSSFGIQQPTRVMDMAGSYDYATLYNQLKVDDGDAAPFSDETVEAFRTGSNPLLYPDVNWSDYVLRDFSTKTQHNLSVSGGSKKIKYFTSLGFLFQDGIIKDFDQDYNNNFNFTRYNYRVNLDIDLTKTTTYKVNIGGWVSKQNEPRDIGVDGGLWNRLMESKPFGSPGIIDGKYVKGNNEIIGSTNFLQDPLSSLYGGGYKQKHKTNLNIDFELVQRLSDITKGLEFSAKGSYNTNSGYNVDRYKSIENYTPWERGMVDGLSTDDPNYDPTIVYSVAGNSTNFGYAENGQSYSRNWYLESKLSYNRTFGDHKVSGLALYNMSKRYYPSAPRYVPRSYLGLVGRGTYSYKNKYLLDINVGYNGSENFAPGSTRYGLFPAFSAGWIITEEKFMKEIPLISYLKFRASAGLVGSDKGVTRFMYIDGVWNPNYSSYDFGVNNSPIDGAQEGQLGNQKVTWETALKQNYGFDMKLFGPKLSLNFDYFIENREDILITRQTVANEFAINLPNVNMGQVENKGYEINLKWRAGNDKFNYYINANMTYAKNKIIEKDEITPQYDYLLETGGATGRTLGYRFIRFYEEGDFTDGELNENLPRPTADVLPGDPMYSDLNDDGIIDVYDQEWSKFGRRPEYVFGLNLGFNYKGFELSAQINGVTNVSRNLQRNFRYPFGYSASRSLPQYVVDERWTPERGQSALLPRPTSARSNYSYANSSLWMWDASYIRLKNLQVAYTFKDAHWLKAVGIKRLKVYVNGLNLLTLDKMKYFDPESGTSSVSNEESVKYPLQRMYNAGVKIQF